MKYVRRTERCFLNEHGVSELQNACDTVHITTGNEKNPFRRFQHLCAVIKNSLPTFNFYKNADIEKRGENIFYNYLHFNTFNYCGPDKTVCVRLNRNNNNIKYFTESDGITERSVRFGDNKDLIQITYSDALNGNMKKSIYFADGKRKVTKY